MGCVLNLLLKMHVFPRNVQVSRWAASIYRSFFCEFRDKMGVSYLENVLSTNIARAGVTSTNDTSLSS